MMVPSSTKVMLAIMREEEVRAARRLLNALQGSLAIHLEVVQDEMKGAGYSRKEAVAAEAAVRSVAKTLGEVAQEIDEHLGEGLARCVVNHDCDPGRPWRCIKDVRR